jgi:hypothetical protein
MAWIASPQVNSRSVFAQRKKAPGSRGTTAPRSRIARSGQTRTNRQYECWALNLLTMRHTGPDIPDPCSIEILSAGRLNLALEDRADQSADRAEGQRDNFADYIYGSAKNAGIFSRAIFCRGSGVSFHSHGLARALIVRHLIGSRALCRAPG